MGVFTADADYHAEAMNEDCYLEIETGKLVFTCSNVDQAVTAYGREAAKQLKAVNKAHERRPGWIV